MSTLQKRFVQHQTFFKKRGFPQTAQKISKLAEDIESDKIFEQDLDKSLSDIMDTFMNESKSQYHLGGEYRSKCFAEIHKIVEKAYESLSERGLDFPSEYTAFLNKMDEKTLEMYPMTSELAKLVRKQNRSSSESKLMFHNACYIYLNAVEGVFRDLARLLFGLTNIGEANTILSAAELNSDHVWRIYRKFEREFGVNPVFLENWEEKSQIRNAIAHGQTQYNPTTETARFISMDKDVVIFDKTLMFNEFFELFLQITDAEDALTYSMRLADVSLTLEALLLVNSVRKETSMQKDL